MSLFNWWKYPVPEPVVDKPKNPEPEPDLSTKPADHVVFLFGWACESKHVSGPLVNALEKIVEETRLCPTCGNMPLRKAVVKRTEHADWRRDPYSVLSGRAAYEWSFRWSVFVDEFVHFLDDKKPRPRRRKK